MRSPNDLLIVCPYDCGYYTENAMRQRFHALARRRKVNSWLIYPLESVSYDEEGCKTSQAPYISIQFVAKTLCPILWSQMQSERPGNALTCEFTTRNGQVQEQGREEGLRRLGRDIVWIDDIVGPSLLKQIHGPMQK